MLQRLGSSLVNHNGVTLKSILDDRFVEDSTIYTVGFGGDYINLNTALAHLSKKMYVATENNQGVTLMLLDNYSVNEQVIVAHSNLSFVTIKSEKTVAIVRESLVKEVDGYLPAFCATGGAQLPVFDVKFDMGYTSGAQDKSVAFLATDAGSSLIIKEGGGCINSYGSGILAKDAATFTANGTVWDGCAGDGVSVCSGASGSASNSTANRCYNGFVANGGVLDATSSTAQYTRSAGFASRKGGVLNAEFADAQNGASYGFYCAISSLLNVTRGNCSGCRFGISGQRNGKIAAEEVVANNCTETNISARRYSTIEAQSCTAINTTTTPLYCIRANYSGAVLVESSKLGGTCTHNICRATDNADIQATDAVLSGAIGSSIAVLVDESSNFQGRRITIDHSTSNGTAVQVARASTADLTNCKITGGGNYGVVSQFCSNVSVDEGAVNGSTNYSLYATDGGKISATKANARQDVSQDKISDIVVSRGGIISADKALGGYPPSAGINKVTSSGIIFK